MEQRALSRVLWGLVYLMLILEKVNNHVVVITS